MSDGTRTLTNRPEVVEPVVAAPVVAEQVVAEPVVAAPLVAEQVVAEPVVTDPLWSGNDPRWSDTVVVDEIAAPAFAAPAPVVPVVDPVVAVAPVAPVAAHAVRRSYARSFAPDAVVAALVGLFLLLVGLLAITRGGFDGPMDTPVVSVLGFTHTTTLGLLEIIIGGALLISGASRSRSGALFFGSILGIASFVGAVQTESFQENLALESSFAWLMVFGAVAVVLSALLLPRYVQRSTVVYPA